MAFINCKKNNTCTHYKVTALLRHQVYECKYIISNTKIAIYNRKCAYLSILQKNRRAHGFSRDCSR